MAEFVCDGDVKTDSDCFIHEVPSNSTNDVARSNNGVIETILRSILLQNIFLTKPIVRILVTRQDLR